MTRSLVRYRSLTSLLFAASLVVAGCETAPTADEPAAVEPGDESGAVAVAPGQVPAAPTPGQNGTVPPNSDPTNAPPIPVIPNPTTVQMPGIPVEPATPLVAAAPVDAFRYFAAAPTGVIAVDVDAAIAMMTRMYGLEGAGLDVRALLRPVVEGALRDAGAADMIGQAVDPLALTRLTVGMWADSESVVAVLNPEVLTSPPAEGGPAVPLGSSPLQAAVRDGNLLIGMGPEFEQSLSGGGYSPGASWPQGWAVVPDNAVMVAFSENVAAMSEIMDEDLFGPEASRAAIAISAGGGFSMALDTTDDSSIRNALGDMQQTTLNLPIRASVPPPLAPLADYVDLVVRSVWGQIRLERAGTVSTLTIAEPTCGLSGPQGVMMLGMIGFMSASEDPLQPGMPVPPPAVYENLTQPIQDGCEPIPGPPARLHRAMAAAGSSIPAVSGYVLSADLGALLRTQLPTLFGLTPYALRHEDVRAALGPMALGLGSLDTADGQFSIYAELNSPNPSDVATAAIAVPQSSLPLIEQIAGAAPPGTIEQGFGYLIADPNLATRLTSPTDTPWQRAMNGVPEDAAFAALLSPSLISSFVPTGPGACNAMLSGAELISISTNADLAPTIRLLVPGNAPGLAAACNQQLLESVGSFSEGVPAELASVTGPVISSVLDSLQLVAPSDTVITLDLSQGSSGMAMFGVLGSIGVPAFLALRSNDATDQQAPSYPAQGGPGSMPAQAYPPQTYPPGGQPTQVPIPPGQMPPPLAPGQLPPTPPTGP